MGQKSAFQAALAPPRGDFSADVARLLPVPDRDFRLDFCGEGPRLYGVSLALYRHRPRAPLVCPISVTGCVRTSYRSPRRRGRTLDATHYSGPRA